MGAMASQTTCLPFVQAQTKENTKASRHWPLCEGNSPVNSTHKGPVTRKMFPFDDIIILPSHVVKNIPTKIDWFSILWKVVIGSDNGDISRKETTIVRVGNFSKSDSVNSIKHAHHQINKTHYLSQWWSSKAWSLLAFAGANILEVSHQCHCSTFEDSLDGF